MILSQSSTIKQTNKITIIGQQSVQHLPRINLAAKNFHHVDNYSVNEVNLPENCPTNCRL